MYLYVYVFRYIYNVLFRMVNLKAVIRVFFGSLGLGIGVLHISSWSWACVGTLSLAFLQDQVQDRFCPSLVLKFAFF